MSTDAEVVRYNTNYRTDSNIALSFLLLGVIALIGAIALFILVEVGTKPKPLYIKANENGQIIEPLPLNDENIISKPALLNWVNDFIIDAFSFNYSTQSKQAFKLSKYLNEAAMDKYLNLLANDDDFKNIALQKFVVTPYMLFAPDIIIAKPYRDRFAWQIRIPLRIEFMNALNRASKEVVLDLLVLRVPVTEFPLGIAIVSFNMRVTSRQAPYSIKRGF